jgi:hypothetical protein
MSFKNLLKNHKARETNRVVSFKNLLKKHKASEVQIYMESLYCADSSLILIIALGDGRMGPQKRKSVIRKICNNIILKNYRVTNVDLPERFLT